MVPQSVPKLSLFARWGRRIPLSGFAIATSLAYLVAGVFWITYSDQVGQALFPDAAALTVFQSYKGLAFVLASSVFILVLLASQRRPEELLPEPRRRWSLSIRARLVLLVVAVVLPLLGMSAFRTIRSMQRDVEDGSRHSAALAGMAAAAMGEFTAWHRRMLSVVATRPGTVAMVAARCDPLVESVPNARGTVANLVTFDSAGRLVCSGQPSAPGNVSSPQAVWDGKGGFSGMAIGRAVREPGAGWVVPLAVEVAAPGRAAVGSVQEMARLDSVLARLAPQLPEGGLAVLVETDGRIIASSDRAGAPAGTQVDPALVPLAGGGHGDGSPVTWPDGVMRQHTLEQVQATPWTVVVGTPMLPIMQVARARTMESVLAGLLVLSAALLLALRLGRGIAEPVRALARSADEAARGDLHAKADESGPLEVMRVATGFNKMMARTRSMLRVLTESEARHRNLVERAPDGIVVQTGRGITYANPRLLAMFGAEPGDGLHEDWLLARVVPAQRDQLAERMRLLGEAPGEAPPLLLAMTARSGQRMEVEHTGSSVRQDGQVVVQSHFLDVTERNRALTELDRVNQGLEAEVARRTQELQDANTALESFSYSVAHDLRAPVARVAGFAEALTHATQEGSADRVTHYADRIAHNARAMEAMIQGLLELARTDRMTLVRRKVDMHSLVEDVLDELGARQKALVELAPLPEVPADAVLLRHVWHNLLSNALKYSARKPAPRVVVTCHLLPDCWEFGVEDNGEGFDTDAAGALFQPFQRLETAAGFDGTGVGLTIVRRVVERHGGRVDAFGRPGEGATFIFTLPISG